MRRLQKLLHSSQAITSDLSQPRNYIMSYLLGAPLYLVLIVMNFRFIVGTLIFNWDVNSWYFTVCYLLFPLVRILLVRQADFNNKSSRFQGRTSSSIHYSRLQMPLHDDISEYTAIRLAAVFIELLLSPLILFALLARLVLQRRKIK